jgi:hypothetical protein
MRTLALMILGLLVVGCGEVENGAYKHRPKPADKNESTPTTNTNKVNGPSTNPVKEPTLEEKALGTYEWKDEDGDTYRAVILANGVVEGYINGEKREGEGKWTISKDEELHVIAEDRDIEVLRINPDGSLTRIAEIVAGVRKDPPKDELNTFIKIK